MQAIARIHMILLWLFLIGCGQPSQMFQQSGGQGHDKPAVSYWDAHFLSGSKVGYTSTHVQRRRAADGSWQVATTSNMHMRVVRFGEETTQTMDMESIDTEDGQIIRFTTRLRNGNDVIETRGTREEDQLRVTMAAGDKTETTTIPWSPDWGGVHAVDQSLQRKQMVPGETRTLRSFLPLMNQVADVTLDCVGHEQTPLLVGTRRLLRIQVRTRIGDQHSFDWISWIDTGGRVLKTVLPALNQETYRTTEAIARDMSGGSTVDIGDQLTVRVNQHLADPHSTRRVVYRARLQSGDPATLFASGLTQRAESLGQDGARIFVQRLQPTDVIESLDQIDSPTDKHIQSSSFIQADDERVAALANQTAAAQTDAWVIARALEQAVHRYIQRKDFSHAFATAAEVARTRQGDCTEHAVLLAAVCRSRGIPARIAIGLVYHPPLQGFAYHMWNEVWINDRWIPLDATLGLGGIGAAHLKIADADLQGTGAMGAFLSVLNVMGQLQLEIESVE
jgi:hypothetical protein